MCFKRVARADSAHIRLYVYAAGNIVGPVMAGYTAAAIGLGITFLGTAGIFFATAVFFPGRVRRQESTGRVG